MSGRLAPGPSVSSRAAVILLVVAVVIIAYIGYRAIKPPAAPADSMTVKQQVDVIAQGLRERGAHPGQSRHRPAPSSAPTQ